MTSASELFYNRRYRLGRTTHDLGFDSLPGRDTHLDFDNHRNHHHHPHHLHDVRGGETVRRSMPLRRLCHRSSYAVSFYFWGHFVTREEKKMKVVKFVN